MCGKHKVRYISSIIVVVFIFIGLCGFAMASASSTVPVKSTSHSSTPTSSKPIGSTPTSSKPIGGVQTGASPAPVITSISTTQGRVHGSVTIYGSYFGSMQGSSYVSFGPFKATVYSNWTDVGIVCDIPPITGVTLPVTEPVTVTTTNGTSNGIAFTVIGIDPTITSIYPPEWVTNSKVKIAITGTGFQSGARVRMNPPPGEPYDGNLDGYDVVAVSSKKITCTLIIGKMAVLRQRPPKDITSVAISYTAEVNNPDGGRATGGDFTVMYNFCGDGSLATVVGFGVLVGVMTLAGTVRTRKRREKKS